LREKLFKKKTKVYAFDEYPTGVCVKADGEYWYVQGKFKRKIPSLRILASWSFPFVLEVEDGSLSSLLTAKPLGFRDGKIVRAMDGTFFLVSDRKLRKIANPDFLAATGIDKGRIKYASDKELALHERGEDLN
jgi:hypothetical protein